MVNPDPGNVKSNLIENEYEQGFGKLRRGKLGGLGECLLSALRLNSNFIFDCFYGLGTNGDKLDAHSYAPEAIADLASSLDHDSGSREAEAQFQDCSLGILIARVDEHAVRAQVRGPYANVFLESFVNHGKFTQLRMPDIPPVARI